MKIGVYHYMYEMKEKTNKKQMECIDEKDESYLKTNEDISRVCWIDGLSDNSSSNVHQRMQDGG